MPNPGSPADASVGPVELERSTIVLTDDADPDLQLLTGTLNGQRLMLATENAEYEG